MGGMVAGWVRKARRRQMPHGRVVQRRPVLARCRRSAKHRLLWWWRWRWWWWCRCCCITLSTQPGRSALPLPHTCSAAADSVALRSPGPSPCALMRRFHHPCPYVTPHSHCPCPCREPVLPWRAGLRLPSARAGAVARPPGPAPVHGWRHPLPLRVRLHPTATHGPPGRRLRQPPARTRLCAPVAVVLAAHGRPAGAHVGAAGRLQQHAQLRAVDVAAVHTAVGSGGSGGGVKVGNEVLGTGSEVYKLG